MNFTPSRKTLEKLEKSSSDQVLQLYREVPDMYINLDEFEECAIERLKGKKLYHYFIQTILNTDLVFSFTNIGTN